MRQRSWLWVVAGFVLVITLVYWYVGRVNSTHPALWAMSGGDAGHRNYVRDPFPAKADIVWKYSLGALQDNLSPVVVWSDGTAYLAADSKVVAVGPDGKRRWAWETGQQVVSLALGRRGNIYALTSTHLYALNLDGSQQWQLEIDLGNTQYQLVVGQAGVIYATGDRFMYAVDSTGHMNWRFKADHIADAVAESPSGKLLLLVGDRLYCLTHQGDTIWDVVVSDEAPNRSVSVSANDLVYVLGRTLQVHGIDGRSGWKQQPLEDFRAVNVALGKALVQRGQQRLDPKAQTELWEAEQPVVPSFTYVLVDSRGNTLVQQIPERNRQESTLFLLDSQGKKQWEYKAARLYGTVAPGQGRFYFVAYDQATRSFFLYCVGER
jgi:hypothetical protein